MSTERTFKHRFLLHYCKKGDHYHLIMGEDDDRISWPFWSGPAARTIGPFTYDLIVARVKDPDELAFVRSELERIEKEMEALVLPPRFLHFEATFPQMWQEFRTGRTRTIYFESKGLMTPLYCDFVAREEPGDIGGLIFRDKLHALAHTPARPLRLEQTSIRLEPVD